MIQPRCLVSLIAALSLSACSSLLPDLAGAPPALYEIAAPASPVQGGGPVVASQLLVDTPLAAPGIDTPRIAVSHTDSTLGYYKNVSWTDRAPAMLQSAMMEALENSKRLPAVGRENVGLRADFLLKTELSDFQAEEGPSGSLNAVNIRIRAKLIAMPERRIIASETFSSTTPVQQNDLQHIFAAFQASSDKSLTDLTNWTIVQMTLGKDKRSVINKK